MLARELSDRQKSARSAQNTNHDMAVWEKRARVQTQFNQK